MTLASESRGSGLPAAFVHGFTQTRTSWGPVTERLPGLSSTLIDAPGHGGSPDGRRSLWECADDIRDTMHTGLLVGYSMGARMSLHCALAHPASVTGLVLISGTPGIESQDERDERTASDNALAARIEEIGTAAFVDEWLGNPMFSGLDATGRMVHQRLANTPSGLANSLRHAGTGTQENLWPRLHSLGMPVLLVAGSRDAKFLAIAERMAPLIPRAELAVIEGAGHTVHLEQTELFCTALSEWIVRTVRAPDPRRT